MKLPETKDGKCTACGSTDFTLAEDTVHTKYTDVAYNVTTGKWVQDDSRVEDDTGQTEEPVRLFCTTCSEYHVVPKELL